MVLLHGSNESARSYTQLALALAGAFTVYLPDRCGRGLSGPDHSMRTEVEDLQAVVAGPRNVSNRRYPPLRDKTWEWRPTRYTRCRTAPWPLWPAPVHRYRRILALKVCASADHRA